MANVIVKRQAGSRQWGIFVDGKLVEGGFFEREAAVMAAREYQVSK